MASRIKIQRLKVVTRDNLIAYDEKFHCGVNIIRGDNSSGKSTITHLLFFGLGGSYSDFVPEAKKCQYVYTEVDISGCVVTLVREIKISTDGRVDSQVGMSIYWGTIEDVEKGNCKSNYFGYKSSEKKKSFSNALFEIMGMPIVIGDNNITMHQLLRLLYVDQESPTSSLYMFEVFDSQITRETVAELLMGIYDSDIYTAKIDIREYGKQLNELDGEIKAVKNALGRPDACSPVYLRSIIKQKEEEIVTLTDIIRKKRNGEIVTVKHNDNAEILKNKVSKCRKEVLAQQVVVENLQSEIDDTTLFINALRSRKGALLNSISIRKSMSEMVLDFCPECLTKLNDDVEEGHCRLCKAPIDNSRGIRQARRYELELGFQMKESEIVLEQLKKEYMAKNASWKSAKSQLETYERLLAKELENVRSPQDEEIDNMLYSKGVLEGEILQYRTMLEKAEYYENLCQRKTQLESLLRKSEDFLAAKEYQQRKNRSVVENKIKECGIYLLQRDLNRQQEFTNADDFYVDFSNNIVYLSNKHSKYSASSNFYLKVVARFAIFMACLEIPSMRFPHFIFADNMEDKGIEIERAQNFQKNLIEKLQEYSEDDYQIIYTTSYITDELDKSNYVVGKHYSHNNKSLKNV